MAATEVLDISNHESNIFVAKDWIKAGKKYTQSLPQVVQEAKRAVLATPRTFLERATIPSPEMPVVEFIQHNLPHVSSEIIITEPSKWFSHDTPTTNLDLLLTRSVPATEFVAKLEEAAGQEWFDGATSIIDHRFNDGADRLPLWVLSFWRHVIQVREIQTLWRKGWIWLEKEKGKGEPSASVQQACQLLQISLAWGIKMSHCQNSVWTWALTRFLGTLWLNDEHISMMVEELVKDMTTTKEQIGIQLTNVFFSVEIRNINLKLAIPSSAKRKTSIGRIEEDVKNNKIKKLYFPLHVNGNHWIAGEIDFKQKTVSFGQYSNAMITSNTDLVGAR
jgi:hypothetical protein